MKELTPPQRDRLTRAYATANTPNANENPAAHIIAALVAQHGATVRSDGQGNRLTCAGVTATCTWSKDVGLLLAWMRAADKRLNAFIAMEAAGA